jgi:protein-L-isoaspartate(D-aspartate) O-methyltransferase
VTPGDPMREARHRMVRGQLIARGISHRRTLAAMAKVPRHLFVPPSLKNAAYDDGPLPVGSRQTISQPYIVALMTEALAPRRGDRVLEVGTGTGYQTAILARLVRDVYTIERLADLAETARIRLGGLGLANVAFRVGDGTLGWSEAAPFDGILVTAATPTLPPALLAQLAPGGRIVAPVGDLAMQELIVAVRTARGLASRSQGACRFVPLIGEQGFEGR